MRDRPLGLPEGSVRSILALTLVGSTVAACLIALLSTVSESGISVIGILAGLSGSVVTNYFNKRGEENVERTSK